MAIRANEQIFRLEISVYDVFGVKMIQPYQYFKEVKFSLLFGHSFDFFKLIEQLSSGTN